MGFGRTATAGDVVPDRAARCEDHHRGAVHVSRRRVRRRRSRPRRTWRRSTGRGARRRGATGRAARGGGGSRYAARPRRGIRYASARHQARSVDRRHDVDHGERNGRRPWFDDAVVCADSREIPQDHANRHARERSRVVHAAGPNLFPGRVRRRARIQEEPMRTQWTQIAAFTSGFTECWRCRWTKPAAVRLRCRAARRRRDPGRRRGNR